MPDKVIAPVEPIELELANAILPLKVAGVTLLLYKELPVIPVELRIKLLALLWPFKSKAAPVLTVIPLAAPLSVPANCTVLLAPTVIEPLEPETMLGNAVVTGLDTELATLMMSEPLSVTAPVPKEPVPERFAFPTCSVVPVKTVVAP